MVELGFLRPPVPVRPHFLEIRLMFYSSLLYTVSTGSSYLFLEWPELIERAGVGCTGSNGIPFKSNAFQALGFDSTARGALFSPGSYEMGLGGTGGW